MITDKLAKMMIDEGLEVYLYTILLEDEEWDRTQIDSYIKALKKGD